MRSRARRPGRARGRRPRRRARSSPSGTRRRRRSCPRRPSAGPGGSAPRPAGRPRRSRRRGRAGAVAGRAHGRAPAAAAARRTATRHAPRPGCRGRAAARRRSRRRAPAASAAHTCSSSRLAHEVDVAADGVVEDEGALRHEGGGRRDRATAQGTHVDPVEQHPAGAPGRRAGREARPGSTCPSRSVPTTATVLPARTSRVTSKRTGTSSPSGPVYAYPADSTASAAGAPARACGSASPYAIPAPASRTAETRSQPTTVRGSSPSTQPSARTGNATRVSR